jgi:GTPase SAR1 family protein
MNILANQRQVVYDITDRQSFDAVGRWLAEVREHAGGAVPAILVGNKADQLE